MKRLLGVALVVTTTLAGGAMAATVNQGTGFALGASGQAIFRIDDLRNPVPPSAGVLLTEGGVIRAVDAITYRPNTNEFFAYADQGNLVFEVDVATGSLTRVEQGMGTNAAGQEIGTTVRTVGFDFNNAIDAARIVSTNDENLVFFPQDSSRMAGGTPVDSSVIRATDLFYVPGDANAGADPSIFANAYTNAVAQAEVNGATQVQYVLDSRLDVLATLGNNTGELRTVGQLIVDGQALDFSNVGGFDILSPASDDNLGLALLNVADGDGVFQSNLYSFAFTGMAGDIQATFVSNFGTGFSSFAVAFNGQPEIAPVPLPASALLLLAGLGGLGALRRMRRA